MLRGHGIEAEGSEATSECLRSLHNHKVRAFQQDLDNTVRGLFAIGQHKGRKNQPKPNISSIPPPIDPPVNRRRGARKYRSNLDKIHSIL